MPIKKFCTSIAASARLRNSRRGNMGSRAQRHSLMTNKMSKTLPRVSMEITMGLFVANCVPSPEMGTNNRIVPEALNAKPQ